jgi:hypothetical protein
MTIHSQMIHASRRMLVLEQLEDKSEDYIRGFFDGIRHESDFMTEVLSPEIERLKSSVRELELSRS